MMECYRYSLSQLILRMLIHHAHRLYQHAHLLYQHAQRQILSARAPFLRNVFAIQIKNVLAQLKVFVSPGDKLAWEYKGS